MKFYGNDDESHYRLSAFISFGFCVVLLFFSPLAIFDSVLLYFKVVSFDIVWRFERDSLVGLLANAQENEIIRCFQVNEKNREKRIAFSKLQCINGIKQMK